MTRNAAKLFSVFLCLLLAGTCAPCVAFADESDATKTAYELQLEIEERQAAYADARAESDEAQKAIDENQARIDELEREIPKQQERSAQAARELYKFQQQSVGIIEMLLSSGSLGDFLSQLEYVNRISSANMDEIQRLNDLRDEIAAAQDDLKAAQSEANARAEDARLALVAAQEAQAEVQRRIEEEARQAAEIAAQAAAMAEQERANDQGAPAVPNEGVPAAPAESSEPEASSDTGSAAAEADTPEASAPDTSGLSDEDAYVAEWGPRIDAYLSGSPLAGQGDTFARAAYKYGVDPRLSPAISYTESGKGQYCFKSHNAWGWGSASWDSWEDAIYDHVAGLASGYGGKLSKEGAKKYCPPNWKSWYNRTLEQMEMI